MSIRDVFQGIGLAVDAAGVSVIAVGVALAGVAFGLRLRGGKPFEESYRQLRLAIGRGVLLGLELLVAGDIIRTVSNQPTLIGVSVLGLIVLIRTFLTFSLEVELTGKWPWNKARSGDAGPVVRDDAPPKENGSPTI